MRQRMQYLYVEIKKTIAMFPRMLLQAVLLMVLIGVVAYCGTVSMKKEPLAVGIDIGIVVREDNTVTQMALGYVENMESVSQVCSFLQVSEEEGFSLLGHGEIAALIVLPEQLIEGIMNGQNPAVDIYFPKNAGLEAMLLRELTESGAELLRVAQAQIYGAYDTAQAYDLEGQLSVMEAEIDSYNLAFALDRLALFEAQSVSATGQMNIIQFYISSGVVLFLLLAGMAVYPVMQREPQALRQQLKRHGTGNVWQCFCQWICGLLCISLFGGSALALLKIVEMFAADRVEGAYGKLFVRRGSVPLGVQVGIVLLIMISVTTLVYLLHSAAGSRTSGILLVFLCSIMMVYLSGGLVPSIFLPQAMYAVGDKLPTAYLIRAVGGLFTGYRAGALGQCMAGMCIYTIAFGILAYWLRIRRI